MNAASISRVDSFEDSGGDSDSDANSDGIPDYYQPISSIDGDLSEPNFNGHHIVNQHNSLSNGHDYGMRSLNLSEDESDDEEEEEEEEDRREESDSAIRRAFEEDDSRRNAPLTEENAMRVIEAMRGVSFSGLVPDWATNLPEDRWVHQLRQSRHSPHSAA